MSPVDDPTWKLRLPRKQSVAPWLAIMRRVGIALAIVMVNWGVVLIEREGYNDERRRRAVDHRRAVLHDGHALHDRLRGHHPGLDVAPG